MDEWYTVRDVSIMLNVDPETVRRWIRSGKIRASITAKKTGYKISKIDYDMFLRKKGVHEMDAKTLIKLEARGKQCTNVSEFEKFRDMVDEQPGENYTCFVCPVSQECNFASEYKEMLREKGLIIDDDIDDCNDIFEVAMKVKLDE